jgi:hypothetical protein
VVLCVRLFQFHFVGSKRADAAVSERNPHDPRWQATDDPPGQGTGFDSTRHFTIREGERGCVPRHCPQKLPWLRSSIPTTGNRSVDPRQFETFAGLLGDGLVAVPGVRPARGRHRATKKAAPMDTSGRLTGRTDATRLDHRHTEPGDFNEFDGSANHADIFGRTTNWMTQAHEKTATHSRKCVTALA